MLPPQFALRLGYATQLDALREQTTSVWQGSGRGRRDCYPEALPESRVRSGSPAMVLSVLLLLQVQEGGDFVLRQRADDLFGVQAAVVCLPETVPL